LIKYNGVVKKETDNFYRY